MLILIRPNEPSPALPPLSGVLKMHPLRGWSVHFYVMSGHVGQDLYIREGLK